jgi:hypothetical protein
MEYYAAWDLALAQQESASAFAESEQPDDEDRQTLTDENLRLFLCENLGKKAFAPASQKEAATK